MARTQAERRAETRQQLLAAARDLIAARGVAGASVDALAEAADRTSGALYAQFGGKDGLLLALLDSWKKATATAIAADFESADDPDDWLASLWRNFVDPPAEGGDSWVLLEHELWLYASRHPEASEAVAARYRDARRHLASALSGGAAEDTGVAALLIGLVIGLEMQRRLDPDAVSDDLALQGLRALLGDASGNGRKPSPREMSPRGGEPGPI
jgi:AcrR family transcriptional regulator